MVNTGRAVTDSSEREAFDTSCSFSLITVFSLSADLFFFSQRSLFPLFLVCLCFFSLFRSDYFSYWLIELNYARYTYTHQKNRIPFFLSKAEYPRKQKNLCRSLCADEPSVGSFFLLFLDLQIRSSSPLS